MNTNARIFVAGHNGMVGGAIVRSLSSLGAKHVITRARHELDLTNQAEVTNFFENERIDEVYLAAAKVGGIFANNTYPAEFIYQNMMIEANVIHQAFMAGVTKLLFLGSSCIYPKLAEQPIVEEALLTGKLEETNEPYAIAKIAGIKLCESYSRQYGVDYRALMPTNLYGPGDNYHSVNSHVVPALLRRMHEAKLSSAASVTVWGSGKPLREFLYVNDLADIAVKVMDLQKADYDAVNGSGCSYINVGTGEEVSIADLAQLIAEVVGYQGSVQFDPSMPDGTPRKRLDVGRLNAHGITARVGLREGLVNAYADLLNKSAELVRA